MQPKPNPPVSSITWLACLNISSEPPRPCQQWPPTVQELVLKHGFALAQGARQLA